MPKLKIALLRGVCQMPAYAAHEQGYFADEGLDVEVEIAATAWLVPQRLTAGDSQLAVIPWTRVAAAPEGTLVLLTGSGLEEAAIVIRRGLSEHEVGRIVVPLRGGIKDLTAIGMIRSLGWGHVDVLRQPSGDGAIIAFFGEGADAASMVEPYATMMESLNVGRVIRRTGDLWSGAPGCSLTTTFEFKERETEVTAAAVRAFVRGAEFVSTEPDRAAEIASKYIGINERFIHQALEHNVPDVNAIRNQKAMNGILDLMAELGYIDAAPSGFMDLSFLDAATSQP